MWKRKESGYYYNEKGDIIERNKYSKSYPWSVKVKPMFVGQEEIVHHYRTLKCAKDSYEIIRKQLIRGEYGI